MNHLIYFGPPGAGKGTQSFEIAKRLSCGRESAGDLLRWHIKKNTAIGQEVKEMLDRGSVAPAELVVRIMVERIKEFEAEGRGWVLDGFPRTIEQAELLAVEGWDHVVVSLSAPEDVLVERLSQRRVCSECGNNYHLEFSPPLGVCQ